MMVITDRPISDTDRKWVRWATPFNSTSRGTVICCSTSSAAWPGHCVMTWAYVSATSGYASIGRAWNEMMPHTKSTSAPPRTSRGLVRATSMAFRSMGSVSGALLGDLGGEFEGVDDQFIARSYALANFQHAVGSEPIGNHFDLAEPLVALLLKHPILVV